MGLKRALGILRRVVLWGGAALLLVGVVLFSIAWFRSTNACDRPPAGEPHDPMKAITYCDYGTSEVLRLEPVEKPTPADDQVLVRVHAASVNPLDWHYMRGTPYFMRLGTGLRKPAETRLGVDFAGTVEAAGRAVTTLQPGDAVFGTRTGALAEFLVARAERSARKPAGLSFEQAASLPVAAVTALQAVRDKGHLQPGEKVLINGSSGGVGTFMVQIAKHLGAQVTGVCSTRNLEMVRSLGADRVIDYTNEDFSKGSERYDLIVDNVGNRSLGDVRRVLAPKGRYVLVGGGGPNDTRVVGPLGTVLQALVLSWFVPQQMGMMLAEVNKEDLGLLAGFVEAGTLKTVIDRRYSLSEVPQAIAYLETGRARGKVIITMDE